MNIQTNNEEIEFLSDIDYFKQKLARREENYQQVGIPRIKSTIQDPAAQQIALLNAKIEFELSVSRIRQHIAMLEDAIVIYKLNLPSIDVPPEVELETLTNLFCQWWFKEIEDAHFFNEAVHNCPTLLTKINTITNKED